MMSTNERKGVQAYNYLSCHGGHVPVAAGTEESHFVKHFNFRITLHEWLIRMATMGLTMVKVK
jgi:hypothetical protein